MTSSQVGIGRRGVRAPLLLEPRLELVVRQLRPLRIALDDRRPRGEQGAARSGWGGRSGVGWNAPGANLTSSGGSGPPGFDRQVEPEHDAVLEVAVGGQQDHRRDLLVAEPLAEPGEQLVGDRGRRDRQEEGELERVAVGLGPAGRVAGQRLDRGGVAAGPLEVGQRVRLGSRRNDWRGRSPTASWPGAPDRGDSSSVAPGRAPASRRRCGATGPPRPSPSSAAVGRRPIPPAASASSIRRHSAA